MRFVYGLWLVFGCIGLSLYVLLFDVLHLLVVDRPRHPAAVLMYLLVLLLVSIVFLHYFYSNLIIIRIILNRILVFELPFDLMLLMFVLLNVINFLLLSLMVLYCIYLFLFSLFALWHIGQLSIWWLFFWLFILRRPLLYFANQIKIFP